MSQKAIVACVEYYTLRKEIDALTATIGAHLGKCFVAQMPEGGWPTDNIKPHLEEFFAARKAAMYYDPDYGISGNPDDGMSEDELKEQCPHCHAALQVIKQRKESRKRLGIAKQKIMIVGRKGVPA